MTTNSEHRKSDTTTSRESSEVDREASIKSRVFAYLREYPATRHGIDHRVMCRKLGLDYDSHKNYLWNLSREFATSPENGQGLKCPNFHAWRGFLYALKGLDRNAAVSKGWVQSRSKNRCLVFPSALGRIEWFETGRINIWVRKPVTEGKKLQLLADGFSKTLLIEDVRVFVEWAKTLQMKGIHCAVDTGVPLPYLKVDLFGESNGVVLVLGDKSHRTSAEFIVNMPDWVERMELLFNQNNRLFQKLTEALSAQGQSLPRSDGDMIV